MRIVKIKNEWLFKALEILEEQVYSLADFVVDFCASSKSDYSALRNPPHRYRETLSERLRKTAEMEEVRKIERLEASRILRRAYNLIYRMKRDGLVQVSGKGRGAKIKITGDGQRKKEGIASTLLFNFPVKKYTKEVSKVLLIVSFDVPEKYKAKRDWLRSVLGHLGFRRLQKSIFIGKTKFPEALIKDLRKLSMINFIEIFAVGHRGTIRQLA